MTPESADFERCPLRGPRRVKGRRIPRSFDLWLESIFAPLDWVDTDDSIAPVWIPRLRKRACDVGCTVIYDLRRHWRESAFVSCAADGKSYILAGGAGKENYCCTVLLHELGHAVLVARHNDPSHVFEREEEAWRVASRIAGEERLPLVASIRRKGLYSYRRGLLLHEQRGSKRNANSMPLPKTGKLIKSRRSQVVSLPPDVSPIGKRGRRKTKSDIKRATAKAERRRSKPKY